MSVHMIVAVRFNTAGDRVEQVRWGRAKRDSEGSAGWHADVVDQDVNLVIDALHFGDEVATAFTVGNDTLLGPRIRLTHSHGIEGIDTIDHNVAGRALTDLPRF